MFFFRFLYRNKNINHKQRMEILIKAAQLILSLSILVIFHEFGHFVFAKLFRTRVEKFYLFFDPWFSLFKFKKGETEYGIGWLPLGGYVKISGMIDESMDKEQMKQPPQPHEFRAKPAWQRLLIMVGGVMVNFLLAIAIYIVMLAYWGDEYLPPENAKYGIICDSLAMEMGLQNGDKILSVDNHHFDGINQVLPYILLNSPETIQVERGSEKLNIEIPDNLVADIISNEQYTKGKRRFISVAYPFVIDGFTADSPAREAGVEKGDRIVGINDKELPYFDQYPEVLYDLKGQDVVLHIERNGERIQIPSSITEDGMIGVKVTRPSEFFEFKHVKYGVFESIPVGIKRGYNEIANYLKQLKLVFQPETGAYKSIGGFGAIGNLFPAVWDWQDFWRLTAMLSIMLAVINILPIPALDGGHVMFLLYELVTGRKPSEKFLEYAQITGMILLLALLVYANGNDIIRAIKG